jgi:hypothetical protein
MTTNHSPLTTADVTIQTATVSVKTLVLGKKQMTLSVFRQLPRRHIIDMDEDDMLCLLGEPWGLVNYFWDGCGYRVHDRPAEHLHVIWQLKSQLYRACVGRVSCRQHTRGWMFCGDEHGVAVIAQGGCEYGLHGDFWECPLRHEESPEVEHWNEFYWQLDRLDQLFIAV